MIPKKGDRVLLNKLLKTEFSKVGLSFSGNWDSVITVEKIDTATKEDFMVYWEGGYYMNILANGTFNYKYYNIPHISKLQVFMTTSIDSEKYCTCGGPSKQIPLFSSVIEECTSCGKEKPC